MNLLVCAHRNQKDALDIDHRCWDGMVQAEFGQKLWTWKKCIKMVPLQSIPSFFSRPKLYQLGIFFVGCFYKFLLCCSDENSLRLLLSYFPNQVPTIFFSSCVCLPSWRGFPQDTSEWVKFSAPPFSHSFAENIWEVFFFWSSKKAGTLFCSLPCLQNWKKCLAHTNCSVSICWINEVFSLPSFNGTDTARRREIYHRGQIFRNSCHSQYRPNKGIQNLATFLELFWILQETNK